MASLRTLTVPTPLTSRREECQQIPFANVLFFNHLRAQCEKDGRMGAAAQHEHDRRGQHTNWQCLMLRQGLTQGVEQEETAGDILRWWEISRAGDTTCDMAVNSQVRLM